jgi:hypothetical protein
MRAVRTVDDLRAVLLAEEEKASDPGDLLAVLPASARRRRRARLAVATAGLAGLGVATAAGIAAQPGRGGDAATAPSATPAAPTPTAPAPTTPAATATASRVGLGAAVRAALDRIEPDAVADGAFPVFSITTPVVEYETAQLIRAGSLRGVLQVRVQRRAGPAETCATVFRPETCRESTGPHGEKILSDADTGDGPGNHTAGVIVNRADGTTVILLCSNATTLTLPGKDQYGIEEGGYSSKRQPLTVAQLTAIGLDPAITIYE